MKFLNVGIKGIGSYLPDNIISNSSIEDSAPTTDKWMVEKLGIKERRRISDDQVNSDIAFEAAIRAISDAGINKEDLDMIIVATSSPEQISPSTSCILNNKLNIKKNVPSFDINAVCSGFVYALSIASSLISTGVYKNILIVASESYSRITDWSHRDCVFFGDGAGAVVLSHSEKGWISSELFANGKETGMTGFYLKHGEKYKTNPVEVWEQAVKVIPLSIESILNDNKMSIDDIDLFIPHQASINMLKEIADKVNLPHKKIKTVMQKYANIAGSSIPIVLDDIKNSGELVDGQTILMSAIGSGWAWGSIIIKYDK
jgi:3-oxoacyl-[acyl-carrier-protein] synthase-3